MRSAFSIIRVLAEGTSTPVSMMVVHTSTSISWSKKLPPHLGELLLVHLPVADAEPGLRDQLLQPGGGTGDGGHVVVEVVHLAAPAQLPADGVGDNPGVVLQHVGLHRVPVVGGLLDDGHVPDAGEGHVERPGDRGWRRGVSTSAAEHICLSFSFWATPKRCSSSMMTRPRSWNFTSLLTNRWVPTMMSMLPRFTFRRSLLLLLGGAEPGQELHVHREALHPL